MKAGWKIKKFKEVCILQRGFDLPKKSRDKGKYPLVSSNGITDNISEYKVKSPGVVTGRSGTIGNVHFIENNFWPLNTSLYVKEFFGNYEKFIFYLLKQLNLEKYSSGAGVPTLNRNNIHEEKIYIPESIVEQRRIVAILDEAFAGIAAAKEKAEQNLKNAKEVFEAHLQGIFATPKHDWQTKKIGDICKSIEYGTSSKSQKSGKMPVLRMGNIQDGKLDWSDLVYSDNLDEIEKYSLRNGDVLFNRTNSAEHVGKTAIFRGEQKAIFAGYLIRINVKKNIIDPEFLTIYLNSRKIREYGFSVMTSSVNQANISGSKLKEYPFLMPPLSEQRQIVSQLDSLSAETSRLESLYQQKLSNLEELKKSLLQQAFSGAL